MKKENYTLKAEAVELFGQKALFTNERTPIRFTERTAPIRTARRR